MLALNENRPVSEVAMKVIGNRYAVLGSMLDVVITLKGLEKQ